jgi:hypothetical protein
MKLSTLTYIFYFFLIYTQLRAEIEVRQPKEFLCADEVSLIVESEGVRTRIELKKNGIWIVKKKEFKQVEGEIRWLIIDWKKTDQKQVLQVMDGKVLLFFDKRKLTYKISVPFGEFLSEFWDK